MPPLPARSRGQLPEELVRRLTAVDGSALQALPQIVAAAGRSRGKWRMHLQFEVWRELPQRMAITPDEAGGEADERSVLSRMLQRERVYVVDRGYERYALFEQIVQHGSDYVCRVQDRPMESVCPQPLSREAVTAGVLRDEIVVLGSQKTQVAITHTVRRLVLAGGGPGRPRTDRKPSDSITLLTNLVDVPAEQVGAIYHLRWSIELFFRFFKHVLGCRHLFSHKAEGIALQVYCADCGVVVEPPVGTFGWPAGFRAGEPVPAGLGRTRRGHRRAGPASGREKREIALLARESPDSPSRLMLRASRSLT